VPDPIAILDCSVSGLRVDCVSISQKTTSKTTYAWSFGDGAGASGKSVSHTYGAAGNYTITLTVSNGSGHRDSDQTVVSISP
jgi:PKD repeat protein